MRDQKTLRRTWVRCAMVATLLLTGGCDALMDVTLPGQLLEEDLDHPRLAGTVVVSVESEFECALGAYVLATSLWAGDWYYVGNTRTQHQTTLRATPVVTFAGTECSAINPPSVWLPLNIARTQAINAAARLNAFTDAEVPNRARGIAISEALAGYGYLLAGEAMCEVAFDGGPLVTREQSFELARARFTAALSAIGGVSGDDEARSIANLARVGRARASLNLGDGAAVLTDAGAVEVGFVREATASTAVPRRYNRVFELTTQARVTSVHPSYHDLTVDGVPDPRVRVENTETKGFDGITDVWLQHKYASRAAPIPFASWREAQLMIAEVQGGAVAVDVINTLRASHGLPAFSSSNEAEIAAQVLEERRRELWLQGTRLGDMRRNNEPFLTGFDPRGDAYGDLTCFPLPEQERLSNPNLS